MWCAFCGAFWFGSYCVVFVLLTCWFGVMVVNLTLVGDSFSFCFVFGWGVAVCSFVLLLRLVHYLCSSNGCLISFDGARLDCVCFLNICYELVVIIRILLWL